MSDKTKATIKATFWKGYSVLGAVLLTLSPMAAFTLLAQQSSTSPVVVNEQTLWSGAILVAAVIAAFFCGVQFYQMTRAVKKVEMMLGLIHAMPCVGHVIGDDGEAKLVIIGGCHTKPKEEKK